MKVVITGGGGFLGRRLGGKLVEVGKLTGPDGQPHAIDKIVLFDAVAPANALDDPRVSVVIGDIGEASVVNDVIDNDTTSVFHFAGIVSAGAEENFDLGYRVNLDGTRHVPGWPRRPPPPGSLVSFGSPCFSGFVRVRGPLAYARSPNHRDTAWPPPSHHRVRAKADLCFELSPRLTRI